MHHYVLCNYPFLTTYQEAEVVSRHTSQSVAGDAARKLGQRYTGASYADAFIVVQSVDLLQPKAIARQLLEERRAAKFEEKAVWAMKCVLDPSWLNPNKPMSSKDVAGYVEETGLGLDVLRERYLKKAVASFEAEAAAWIEQAERRARIDGTSAELERGRSEFTFSFPAVVGIQAGHAYYTAQVPYKMLIKLFTFDDEILPAEHRAQRILNERRASAIGAYMEENRSSYVLPAITASVSQEMHFEPVVVDGISNRLGMLHIPCDAKILINDGQHRRAGIERAIAVCPALAEETIAVTILFDRGLERSQQWFADINANAVKPSAAISALYNQRDAFGEWSKRMIKLLPDIGPRIDYDNSSVGARSSKLWSLVAFRKFLSLLTGLDAKTIQDELVTEARLAAIEQHVLTFIATCRENIPQWDAMIESRIAALQVRENYVIGHAVFLEALGLFGRRALFDTFGQSAGVIFPANAKWSAMERLKLVAPARTSTMWENRCVVLGKMQKTTDGVKTTAARLLSLVNVPLTAEMAQLEAKLKRPG